ncbi:MAG TPA: hypothetical protein VMW47_01755 [Verrucomicrobiae bacterium]|nr:hypothetical protein [Verrucomicrobiae bacterium]
MRRRDLCALGGLVGTLVTVHGVTSKRWQDAHTAAVLASALCAIIGLADNGPAGAGRPVRRR